MSTMRSFMFLLCAGATIACGLEDGGVLDVSAVDTDSGLTPDASVTDGNVTKPDGFVQDSSVIDVTPPTDTAWPCGVDPSSCANTTAIPNGWTPVAVASSNTACAPSFGTETHVKSAPSAQAGACDCQAQNDVSPSCENGTLQTSYGTSGCGNVGGSIAVANGSCTIINGNLSQKFAAKTIAASGGSCTGAKVIDVTKLTASDLTVCQAITCPEKVCAGVPPQGFAACIEAPNDVACPNGSPFTNKQTIGDSATLDCSACTCTASATCDTAKVEFFDDVVCALPRVTLLADNSCQNTNNSGAIVLGAKYTANVVSPTYTASGPKTPSVGLVNTKTICCR